MQMTTAIVRAIALCALATLPASTMAAQSLAPATPAHREIEVTLLSPLADGGSFGDEVPARADIFETARLVHPNILGLAVSPTALVVPDPSGRGDIRLPVVAFDAREGFKFDDEGNVLPSDDSDELSFSIHARSGGSNVHVRIHRGRMHATLNGDRGAFVIEFNPQERSHVLQIANRALLGIAQCAVGGLRDEPKFAPIAKRVGAGLAAPADLAFGPLSMPKNPTFSIGVLVAYTPQALAQAGDVTSLEMTADAAIEQVNRALMDSGQAIYNRVQRQGSLVQTEFGELTFAQQPIPSSRFAFIRNSAQASQPMGAARVAADADIVVTLVADEGNPTANPPAPFYGVAFTQRPGCQPGGFPITCAPGPAYSPFAFAVVSRPFATVNYTFAHEIGHTMGAEHEPRFGVNEGLASFLHSYGHRVSQVAMDIMADPLCITPNQQDPDGTPLVCTTKFLQYANPTVYFFGTQVPSGTTTPFDPVIDGNRTRDVSLTFRKLGSGTASLVGDIEPERLFWDGLE